MKGKIAMKKLMLGNEAFARGLYEAGCKVVSSYPGTPSTEITEAAAKYDEIYAEWAPNEKVAMEVALGASIAGVRSFCGMKHVGLNVAADPLYTAGYTGVTGGMVIAVADDPGMHSSQNEQDSRHHAAASKTMMIEPSDSAECKEYTKLAFELSEKFDVPVIVRMSTRVAPSQSAVELCDREEREPIPYEKNAGKYVMMPGNAIRRHPIVEDRMRAIAEYGENCPLNTVEYNDSEIGVVTAGICYQYAKEALGDKVSYLKLGIVNPMPVNIIKDFAAKCKKIIVIEELDDVIETHCKKNGIACQGKELFGWLGEINQVIIRDKVLGIKPEFDTFEDTVPVRPPVMCAGCPHRGLFYCLSKLKVTVSGDIGCYTLGATAPLCAMDSTICMGASISALPIAASASRLRCSTPFAIPRDSAFSIWAFTSCFAREEPMKKPAAAPAMSATIISRTASPGFMPATSMRVLSVILCFPPNILKLIICIYHLILRQETRRWRFQFYLS